MSNFAALKTVGGIRVEDNLALETVADFSALDEITGFEEGADADYAIVHIEDNLALRSFGKLGTVSEIDGHVRIVNNPELTQADVDILLAGISISGDVIACNNKDGDVCE